MNLPPEFFATELTATEFKVVVSLYHLSGPEWLVEATTDELGVLTGYSAESLRRAFRGLEKAGLLDTVRTKRNFGKWSKNRYQLVLPSHNTVDSEPEPSLVSVGWSEPPSHKSVGSTRSTTWLPAPAINYNNYKTSVIKNTTYSLRNTESVPLMKGVSVEKWKPLGEDMTGDDDIGGFGLFDDEVPAAQKPKLSMNKKDPKTRGRRPESEWTPFDVAVEFQFQLGRRFPYIPGLVNTRAVAGALRGYRSKVKTTGDIEMEIMRMFFEDERNLRNADEQASTIHTRYLSMFKTHMTRAYERLGLDSPVFKEDQAETVQRVYASDGKEFTNSLLGRKRLTEYELKLTQKGH
jgi:hypothetical protein